MTERILPRVMIAAPGSGSGKTMITCGILELLRAKGQPVAYKCGPDYIDPMFHRFVLGIPSRNLDTFFTVPEVTRYLMGRAADSACADMAVIEGVMGYYDGLGGISTRGSSYELSVQTETPVILVVNGRGMSLSLVALIRGFLEMYSDQRIAGIILNRVSGAVCERLAPVIEKQLGVAVVGYVPETTAVSFPGRHLGLLLPEEITCLREQITELAGLLQKTLDMDKLRAIADTAPPLVYEVPVRYQVPPSGIKIALARDEAFCFYYEDNLELLRKLGAELVPFSPMRERQLPEGIAGIYMGGGYPELHAQILSDNRSMQQSIAQAVAAGMPCLAECGAFMYLHEEMEDEDGRSWPMAGVIPGRAEKKGRLVRFGYAQLTSMEETLLGPAGMTLPVHEFHYWDTTCSGGCFVAAKPLTDRTWQCMYQKGSLLAGFPHFYFYGNPEAARYYVEKCRHYNDRIIRR